MPFHPVLRKHEKISYKEIFFSVSLGGFPPIFTLDLLPACSLIHELWTCKQDFSPSLDSSILTAAPRCSLY